MAREKLEAALVPLGLSLSLSVSVSLSVTLSAGCAGFKRDHIEILAEVIEWVRSGSPSSADSPEPPSAAAEEGEAPAPDASKCCEAEPPAAVGEQALKPQTVGRQQAVEGSEPEEEPHQPAVRRAQGGHPRSLSLSLSVCLSVCLSLCPSVSLSLSDSRSL